MSAARSSALASLALLAAACTYTRWQADFATPGDPIPAPEAAAFLKAHMRSGDVYVLGRWSVDDERTVLRGEGLHYDEARAPIGEGTHEIPLRDVALLETNRPRTVTRAGPIVMGVVTAGSLSLTVYCASNPKACFGSCPTFYADDGRGLALQAEGFSASVARVFEATDVDALMTARPEGGSLSLVMRNEALETHLVRGVSLLAVPRAPGARVLRAGERFYAAREISAPIRCTSGTDDCLAGVAALDGAEYAPLTDPDDLGARQTIELVFPAGSGPRGVVVSGRNSLVSTFLFYQLLAYLGTRAGEWLVSVEGGDAQVASAHALGTELTRLELEVRGPDGAWISLGVYDELGPIARDRQVFPIPDELARGEVHVRVRLTQGFWKLDELGLASLGPTLAPVRVEPHRILRRGARDAAAEALLRDPEAYLVTYPGDAYALEFALPSGDHELFVEARGYYVEWLRTEWLVEQDAVEAARFLVDLPGTLRRLAPVYKRMEAEAERVFWQSRVGEAP